MCLADGTPIAVLATRGTNGTWAQTGWLNLATGGYVAGRPPATAAPCAGGDASTLTGLHVERWCDLAADGSVLAGVLVSYEFDDTGAISAVEFHTPDGQPYLVQGTLGVCDQAAPELPGRELVKLCDTLPDGTVSVFVRDYERDDTNTVVGFTDYTLDGQPYTPNGTVGACDTTEQCANPTTPLATTGLCLADGTPIATVATRDCDGVVSTDGWINLLTNTYSAGQPPAGTRACGETSAFDVSGVLCDTNPDGDVLGLVLIEVERGTDGEITGTRLINAADGSEYTLQGELTVCPAGVEQTDRDLIELCDLVDAGEDTEATRFLRDYTRDENGAIVGYTDYTLDGQPYTPTGDVASCDDVPEQPAQIERDLIRLCDTIDGGEDVETVEFIRDYERDTNGQIVGYTDYTLDGQPYEPQGEVGQCGDTKDRCEQTTSLLRLCDLNPDAPPDSDGRICAVPFLRHLVHDCDGNVVSHHDTEPDGTTPYTPVQVVDCATHTPALVEVPWVTVSVEEDPNGPEHQAFIFRISPVDDPDTVGTVRVQTSRQAGGACGDYDLDRLLFSNTAGYTITLDEVAQSVSSFKVNLIDFDWFEPVQITGPMPTRLGGTAVWNDAGNRIVPTEDNGTGEMYWDAPPPEIAYTIWNTGGGNSCSQLSFEAITFKPEGCCTCDTTNGDEPTPEVDAAPVVLCDTIDDGEGEQVVPFLRSYQIDNDSGTITGHTDTELDGSTPYEPVGTVGVCSPTGDEQEPQDRYEVEVVPLCVLDADGEVVRQVLVEHVYDTATGERTETRTVDPVTGEPVELAEGETIGQCVEPCRDTQQQLLCDVAAVDRVTVFDPVNVPGDDGWEVVSFEGANPGYGPEEAMPYPAPHPADRPAYMGARSDLSAGAGETWPGYQSAPVRWVLRKTFTAPEDGTAVVESTGFRGDGGARVRLNGVDAGLYGQWNQPATNGTAQIPVTAGPNTIEIEVRDGGGANWVQGRLDVAMPRTTQFFRTVVTDCETGEVISTTDTTLDGQPYEVTGEVEQCQPANSGGCCDEPSQDIRCETFVLCDTGPDGDDPVSFMRAVCRDSTGAVVSVTDTELDAITPYTVRS